MVAYGCLVYGSIGMLLWAVWVAGERRLIRRAYDAEGARAAAWWLGLIGFGAVVWPITSWYLVSEWARERRIRRNRRCFSMYHYRNHTGE